MFISSEKTNGIGQKEMEAMKKMVLLSEKGFEKTMQENELNGVQIALPTGPQVRNQSTQAFFCQEAIKMCPWGDSFDHVAGRACCLTSYQSKRRG